LSTIITYYAKSSGLQDLTTFHHSICLSMYNTQSCISLVTICQVNISSLRPKPLGLFLPPGNHLPISFMVFLYFLSLQVYNLIFFEYSMSYILYICSLQFILYCDKLSLILNIPNCSLMSLLFLSQSVYPAIGLKNLILAASIFLLSDRFRDQFSLPYI
jgi:hypothetical protein